jgi:hypothetical protein
MEMEIKVFEVFSTYWTYASLMGLAIGSLLGVYKVLYEISINNRCFNDDLEETFSVIDSPFIYIIKVWKYPFFLGLIGLMTLAVLVPTTMFYTPKIVLDLTKQVRKYFKKQFVQQKPDMCPVCYEPFEELDSPLSCGHYIHRECILKTNKNICCLCKEELNFETCCK